jgi:hypothetical protein
MPPGMHGASMERVIKSEQEGNVGTRSDKSKPREEHAEASREDDHSKLMAAWAWKREHL